MENLIWHCVLIVLGISIISGILGPFIVWRHMACFTDTVAHTTMLGFITSIIVDIPSIITVFSVSALLSILIANSKVHSTNTMLTIVNSSTFALSMIIISLFPNLGIKISSLLFGDILLATNNDLLLIYLLVVLILFISYFRWKEWIIIVISEDIAKVENIKVHWIKIEFMLIISLFVSIIMHIIGTLLISAMIIIPAATARTFAKGPLHMVIITVLTCIASSLIGLFISFTLDITTSAAIVGCAIVLFIFSSLIHLYKDKAVMAPKVKT